MSSSDSVSQWIADLKQGDEEAVGRLWERYFEKMVLIARGKLKQQTLAGGDEEDVALSVFDCLCRGAVKGNFPQLKDRNDLWQLLITITAQKSIDRIRWERRQRRGGGRNVLRDCELPETDWAKSIDEIISAGPTAEFLAIMDEQHTRLLSQLRDDTLRDIVKWKLAGHTNKDIAQFQGISVHAIGRKLRLIRLAWTKELDAPT